MWQDRKKTITNGKIHLFISVFGKKYLQIRYFSEIHLFFICFTAALVPSRASGTKVLYSVAEELEATVAFSSVAEVLEATVAISLYAIDNSGSLSKFPAINASFFFLLQP